MEPNLKDLITHHLDRPIFYITPDPNFALGLAGTLPQLHIITSQDHPVIPRLVADGVPVFCLQKKYPDQPPFKNSGSILAHPDVEAYIKNHSPQHQPIILYFKPSPKLDKLCQTRGYLKAANSSSLNKEFEDKLLFYKIYHKFSQLPFLPSAIINLSQLPSISSISEAGTHHRLVIQAGRGWAGNSTFFASTDQELNFIKAQLGDVDVKITGHVPGPTYTINGCVTPTSIVHSPPALQIPPLSPEFSQNPATTCGRQWAPDALDPVLIEQIDKLSQIIGSILQQSKFLGFFGVDFLIHLQQQKVYLLEVNPRFTASDSFYTQLQLQAGFLPFSIMHLLAFLQVDYQPKGEHPPLTGTQLTIRNTHSSPAILQNELTPGFYSLKNTQFTLTQPGYHLSSIPDYLLRTPQKLSAISPNSELLRIETIQALVHDNSLPQELLTAIIKLKHSLISD